MFRAALRQRNSLWKPSGSNQAAFITRGIKPRVPAPSGVEPGGGERGQPNVSRGFSPPPSGGSVLRAPTRSSRR
eukprot:4292417-Pyramimonas_sp.AAC.1